MRINHDNWTMKSMLVVSVTLLSVTTARAQVPQLAGLSLYSDSATLGGQSSSSPQPDLSLFRDPVNNSIGKACLQGATESELLKLGIADLEERLDRLVNGHAVSVHDDRCFLTFPAIVGEQQQELEKVAREGATKLAPRASRIVERIRNAVSDREDLVFHLLWSRVIDTAWDRLWEPSFGEAPHRRTTWIVYPRHPLTVGTNYYPAMGGGLLAVTWSHKFQDHFRLILDALPEIHAAAWEKELPAERLSKVQEAGLFDSEGNSRVLAYHAGDRFDQLFDQLTSEYASAVRDVYDYRALGASFGITPEDMFFILLHEAAYALFDNLSRAGKLEFPSILQGGTNRQETVQLVSLRVVGPPRADDQAMYLFIATGWRGNEETVKKFREAFEQDPSNLIDLLYLGFSLYEVKRYGEAIDTFETLNRLTENEPEQAALHDWARVWVGHMYDLLGEREKALDQYRAVLDSQAPGTMTFGQYGIEPITAKAWAEQRILSPFTRR